MLNTTPTTGNTITPANTNTHATSYPNVTPDNGKITVSSTVHYFVMCKELGLCKMFDDYDTAHIFATQLAQDYPTANIERYKNTQFFDSWGNDTGGKA